MKECCKVGDSSRPSKSRKTIKRVFWALLLAVIIALAIADAMGS